ncbi:hypothetical protein F8M49_21740 [Rhodococcus zopfii]|uniref:Uncharacterized protein n=1 Tax=Rhodococcus zopfii TaxID=43772 RepID=A0ABU3WUR2_9NOCA|nr:hypothetical protein [Rhodococcus zopfii]
MDQLIGDLAVKMAEWTLARDRRIAEIQRLQNDEYAAEEAVVRAFEAARTAGAKVKALEKINLKPSEAIAAVNKRAKNSGGPAVRPLQSEVSENSQSLDTEVPQDAEAGVALPAAIG